MKKVVVSTLFSVIVLWCFALAVFFMSRFTEQVTNFMNTGSGIVNDTYFFASIILAGVTIIIFFAYFMYRWKQANKKEKISLFKFIFTEINAADDDERELEISRKSTIASVKVMDGALILGVLFAQQMGLTPLSMEMMLVYVIVMITIRELFYLYKWYRLY